MTGCIEIFQQDFSMHVMNETFAWNVGFIVIRHTTRRENRFFHSDINFHPGLKGLPGKKTELLFA